MPAERKQSKRIRAAQADTVLSSDAIANSAKRHLNELEQSNYTEDNINAVANDEEEPNDVVGGRSDRSRTLICEKRPGAVKDKKKKSTMNVRTALLYRKNLDTFITESKINNLPPSMPSYLRAGVSAPKEPPRVLCTVCGYWGAYKCKKCTMSYCDMRCQAIHDETRCEKRVI